MLSTLPSVWKGLVALLCGAMVPLGFSPFGFYLLPVVALAILASLLYGITPRLGLLLGALFGLGEFVVGVSWVHISIHQFGNAGMVLSLATVLLLALYLALFSALMGWLVGRLSTASRTVVMLAVFPAAWTLTELLRGWLFSGFPWLNLGYSQIDSPLLGFAPLLGVYAVGFVTALSAGLLNCIVTGSGRLRVVALASISLIGLTGWALNQYHWTQRSGEPLTATLVQGNIPQELKWKPEQQRQTLERYVSLTNEHTDSDLIVWPETAVPSFYDQVEGDFLVPLREDLQAKGVSLVTGIPVLDRSQWNYYNAVISLDQPGRFYYKAHLVPFGEYLPLRDWLANVLSFLPVPPSDFTSGGLDQPLLKVAGYPVGASICYEIAFGEEIIHTLPQAAFLINISNDAWFGDSLAPHQHLEMARMRARETERYLLRATNTGISAIIDADGQLIVQSPQFEMTTVTGTVQPRSGATPYVRWGNRPVLILSIGLLLMVWRIARK
ncbi:Apolipoprotein N-acyltransferase / Copper homeostasis protein CutE [hydrothermal vent metagenome]|uniref:Apolipoprotein N-acyltransferase / Copper homeostasis protein CutE n=1 Tax=hydrothermal vent metagenome TaxID=652676 RepID=A0A3B0Y3D5_9ZZZZ